MSSAGSKGPSSNDDDDDDGDGDDDDDGDGDRGSGDDGVDGLDGVDREGDEPQIATPMPTSQLTWSWRLSCQRRHHRHPHQRKHHQSPGLSGAAPLPNPPRAGV